MLFKCSTYIEWIVITSEADDLEIYITGYGGILPSCYCLLCVFYILWRIISRKTYHHSKMEIVLYLTLLIAIGATIASITETYTSIYNINLPDWTPYVSYSILIFAFSIMEVSGYSLFYCRLYHI